MYYKLTYDLIPYVVCYTKTSISNVASRVGRIGFPDGCDGNQNQKLSDMTVAGFYLGLKFLGGSRLEYYSK